MTSSRLGGRWRALRCAAVAATAFALGACGAGQAVPGTIPSQDPGSAAAVSEPPEIISGSAAYLLPWTLPIDWVTYADHVLVVSMTGDFRLPTDDRDIEVGEGLVGRQVEFDVLDILWSRELAPELASEHISWQQGGWVFNEEDGETAFALENTVELLRGHHYIVPVTQVSLFDEPLEWAPLHPETVLPTDEGVIGRGSTIWTEGGAYEPAPERGSSVREQVWGHPVEDLVTLLRRTPPDPAAVPFMDLEPVDRFRSALAGEAVDFDGDNV